MAKVAVIIPVYNVEKYVDRCLNSVVNQTFQDMEIIIVHDAGNDESGEKCLEWAGRDGRVIYVRGNNEGIGAARNLGIQIASAEFIAFCDADDWYDEKYIELMLAKQLETDADIVICDYNEYDGELEKATAAETYKYLERTVKNWAWQLPSVLWLKLIRRSLFSDHDIKMPNCGNEDAAIHFFIMTKAKKIAVIEQALYFYWFNRADSGTKSYIRGASEMPVATVHGLDLFVRDNIFEEYKKDLRDAAFGCLNHWYPKIKDDAEFAEKYLSDCRKVIKKYFGDMTGIFHKKSCVIGSYSLFNSLPRSLLWVPSQKGIDEYPFSGLISYMSGKAMAAPALDNPFRRAALDRDLSKSLIKNIAGMDYDYIIIDFLDERFDIAEVDGGCYTISDAFMEAEIPFVYNTLKRDDAKTIEMWKEECLKFIALLRARFPANNIIMVKNFLAERFGNSERQIFHDRLDEIKHSNAVIGGCYDFFENNFPGIKVIDLKDMELFYTYENFRHGREPWHYNEEYYLLMREDILNHIAGL